MTTTKSPNPIDRYVGGRVRMQRRALDISMEKLGDALGLTYQQVQKYEKGTNRIGASRLQHIAHVLKVSPAFFFEGGPTIRGTPAKRDDLPSPAEVMEFPATSDGFALVKAFKRIKSKNVRQRIVRLVREISDHKG